MSTYNKGHERTAAYDIEYLTDYIDGTGHQYSLYYILDNKSHSSNEFDTYQIAFDKAVNFCEKIVQSDLPKEIKLEVLNSLQILDCDENKAANSFELKNIILNMIKDLT